MGKLNIKNIAIIIIVLFILNIPFMIKETELNAYKKGWYDGSDAQRTIIYTDLNNGVTYVPNCIAVHFTYPADTAGIICGEGTWDYSTRMNASQMFEKYKGDI